MSGPWRPIVAAWALAGFVVTGPGAGLARATTAAGDSIVTAAPTATADTTVVPPAPPPVPSAAPKPATAPAAPPAPTFHAELKPEPRSRTRAWIAIGGGAALSIGSFLVAKSADRAYDEYLVEPDPEKLEDHYQDAKTLDRISAGMLIAGQAAIALGLYWGFIQRPPDAPVRTFGIAPDLSSGRAGVAIVVPLP